MPIIGRSQLQPLVHGKLASVRPPEHLLHYLRRLESLDEVETAEGFKGVSRQAFGAVIPGEHGMIRPQNGNRGIHGR
jgi:hypothetical protein